MRPQFDCQTRVSFSLPMANSDHEAARLIVRLGTLKENYRELARRAGSAMVAPVVKADAYGLGIEAVAGALSKVGADTYFVARLAEGASLRRILPRARIFVLDGLLPGTAPAYRANNLIPVLNSLDEIGEWGALAREARTTLAAAIQMDTGMNRSGLTREETNALAAQAAKHLSGIELALVMSHLACSDDPGNAMNAAQLQRFRDILAALPPAPASLAASGGVSLGRDYVFDVVRPGIALYGGNPQPALPSAYRVVAVLMGRALQLRRVDKGDTVGYGATFTAGRPSMLVTVTLGYADGLSRALATRGVGAAAGGKRMSFAGRISMDLAVLDATDVPEELCRRGAEIEFFGDTISLEEVAGAAGTISYDVLTSVSSRVPRHYVEG